MATEQELQAQYEKLKAAREELDNAPRNADGTRTVNGKKIAPSAFKTLIDDAKKKESAARKASESASKVAKGQAQRRRAYVSDLQSKRRTYLQRIALLSAQIEKGSSPNPEAAQNTIDSLNTQIAEIDSALSVSVSAPTFDQAGQVVVPEPAAGEAPVVSAQPSTETGGPVVDTQEGLRRRGQVAGGFGKTAPAQPKVEPKEQITPGGGVGRGGGKLPSAPKMNWDRVSAKFRELFPTQAWILDVDPAKYPDVRQVIESAVTLNETPERFAARFQNTSFYKELATTNKVRDIKALVGDAGFDSVPFNAFVTKAMNLGWEGDTLRFEAYKEAFRKDDTGQFVNPTAVTRIKKSNDYLGIANIGKAYFNQVSDDTIQRTLTGEMTTEDVQRQQREVAKARYGHLAPLIDQGLTLDEISGSFKTAAAQLLEVDPNTIDMSNAQYEVALNFGEEGKKRVMTNGEWQKLLRTDARYGWDKTENAKREARELANTISQAFGRII